MKLWKEYAIEPALFANYHLGSEILAGVGFDQGRIVGALPKKWSRAVRDQARNYTEMQRQRLIERLQILKEVIVPRIDPVDATQPYPYDGNRPWRDQALECHRRSPFDGIVVNGQSSVGVCIDATLGLAEQHAWEHSRQLSIPREATALAQILRPLLSAAHEVIVVDAHFDPSVPIARSKWLRPLQAMAAQLSADGRVTRFEVHALSSRHSPWGAGLFAQHCRNNLAAALPKDVHLEAMLWKERDGGLQFHKRLIVTDLGGLVIDPGIDDGPAGEAYDLHLLSKQEIPTYFDKFVPVTSPFTLVDQVRVTGN